MTRTGRSGPKKINKRIDGRIYMYSGFHLHKKDAVQNAEAKRRKGWGVRIIPGVNPHGDGGTVYNVYVRSV